MLPDMYGLAARTRMRQEDLLREAERERLATVARATMTSYRNRRFRLRRRENRDLTPVVATGQVGGRAAAPPRPLVTEPAT